MQTIQVKDYEALSLKAARIVAGRVEFNPGIVLGLPTGNTPEGMYKNLVQIYKKDSLSFKKTTVFNLDEYVGIKPGHPGSFNKYMQDKFFDKVDINIDNTYIPGGDVKDIKRECERYENKIKEAGGIDLLILGIGENGHLAFLEPGESLPLKTDVVKLSEQTRENNSDAFTGIEKVPARAITMGLDTILSAEEILLLASGERKAKAVNEMLNSEVSTRLPASFLKLHHNITVIVDRAAGQYINNQ